MFSHISIVILLSTIMVCHARSVKQVNVARTQVVELPSAEILKRSIQDPVNIVRNQIVELPSLELFKRSIPDAKQVNIVRNQVVQLPSAEIFKRSIPDPDPKPVNVARNQIVELPSLELFKRSIPDAKQVNIVRNQVVQLPSSEIFKRSIPDSDPKPVNVARNQILELPSLEMFKRSIPDGPISIHTAPFSEVSEKDDNNDDFSQTNWIFNPLLESTSNAFDRRFVRSVKYAPETSAVKVVKNDSSDVLLQRLTRSIQNVGTSNDVINKKNGFEAVETARSLVFKPLFKKVHKRVHKNKH